MIQGKHLNEIAMDNKPLFDDDFIAHRKNGHLQISLKNLSSLI